MSDLMQFGLLIAFCVLLWLLAELIERVVGRDETD